MRDMKYEEFIKRCELDGHVWFIDFENEIYETYQDALYSVREKLEA